jgi:hypothetical protein
MKDATLQATGYLPAAGAANTTPSIDLGASRAADTYAGAVTPEKTFLEVSVPAMPNNTDDSKTTTIDLYESADDVTFTAVDPLVSIRVPGVASTGSAARTVRYPLPPTLRYIALRNCAAARRRR